MNVQATATDKPSLQWHREKFTLCQAITFVALDILYIFVLFLGLDFGTSYWMARNLDYHDGGSLFGIRVPYVSLDKLKSIPEIREKISDFMSIQNISTEEEAYRRIQGSFIAGSCHGECVNLLELLQANPYANLSELLPKLTIEKTALFQAMELFRHTFKNHNRQEEIDPYLIQANEPIPVITVTKKKQEQEVFNYLKKELEDSENKVFILRKWNSREAHSVLLRVSHKECSLYDSFTRGVYNFPSPSLLCAETINALSHIGLSTGTNWSIETFDI